MKHIKEFKLNEDNSPNPSNDRLYNMVKEYVIGSMIEDYEFTNVFLDKGDVQSMIDMNIDILTKEIQGILDRGSKSLGGVLQSVVGDNEISKRDVVTPERKKLPRYDKNYRPDYGSSNFRSGFPM